MALTLKKFILNLFIPLATACILAGILIYIFVNTKIRKNPVIKCKVGLIRGLRADDGDYDMFLGVPYAVVNDKNVFGDSLPRGNFKKIYEAHNDSVICPQYEEFTKTIQGSLACLHLNIYRPHVASTINPVPVMVFIHGGDYLSGFGGRSLYGPKYLMKHNIIVVTVNYRIGPYGFFCINVPEISGNQGLKDQVLALRWVRDNIKSFGGRPEEVTLVGVGSGGENVNLHLLYGQEELFSKVIIDSGIYLDQLDEEDGIESVPIEIAENIGYKVANEIEALSFLNTENTNSIVAASTRLHIQYGPCIEKNDSGVHTFITNETINAENKKNNPNIPILISHSSREALEMLAHVNLDDNEASEIFEYELVEHFKFRDERLKKAEKILRQFYIGDEKVSEAVRNKIVDFKSDLYHYIPTRRMIEKYLKVGRKVYYGVFSYSGERNYVKRVNNIVEDGATRGDVLGYIFDMSNLKKQEKNDQLIIDRMTALWSNFVKYGDPTPVTTVLLPEKWEPVAKGKINYMEISKDLTPRVTSFYNRTVFWDVFLKMNGKQEVPTKLIEPWLN